MFPSLDPLDIGPTLLMRAGDRGGICDAATVLDGLNAGTDDAAEAAGWPFFGQLIAHDITADRSPIDGGSEPGALRNARAPKLNLEMLYSDGPIGSPYLFDLKDPAKFLLGPDGFDVPRNRQGVAVIGDPRNDVHLFSLTLHVALLHAHNRIVDRLRADGVPEIDVFSRARILLTWQYQWTVVNDFLPRLVGRPLVEQALAEGGRWFTPAPGQAYIPLEFADAAYRYGQIRHTYRLVAGVCQAGWDGWLRRILSRSALRCSRSVASSAASSSFCTPSASVCSSWRKRSPPPVRATMFRRRSAGSVCRLTRPWRSRRVTMPLTLFRSSPSRRPSSAWLSSPYSSKAASTAKSERASSGMRAAVRRAPRVATRLACQLAR